ECQVVSVLPAQAWPMGGPLRAKQKHCGLPSHDRPRTAMVCPTLAPTMKPREIVQQIETNPALPAGSGDRFAGYAVIGLPFRSEHVLALRRFPASSVGPGYTSVWHRDPRGVWTFYSTVNPDLGCSRYFGGEIMHNVVAPIGIEWTGPAQFS